jgi:hypothetical protein
MTVLEIGSRIAEALSTQRRRERRDKRREDQTVLTEVQDSPLRRDARVEMRSLRFLCDLCVSALKGLLVWFRLGRVRERFPDTSVDFSNGALRLRINTI